MKTAQRLEEYWVVEVEEPPDLEKGVQGYKRRFTFSGEDSAQRAWSCAAAAEEAGFLARAEKAKRF